MITSRVVISLLLSVYLITVNLLTGIADTFSIERSLLVTPFLTIFTLLLFFLISLKKNRASVIPKSMAWVAVAFIFVVVIPAIVGATQNTILEVLPSFLRYFSYFLAFMIFYHFSYNNVYDLGKLDNVLKIITLILFISSCWQILSNNLIYMNGAYRLSSIYGATPAGFALITLVLSIYYYCQMFTCEKSKSHFVMTFALFCISALMMTMTQSRQSIVTLLLLIGFFHFVKAKKSSRFIVVLFSALMFYLFYWLIVNTDLFPRLTQMFFNYSSDSSTHTRVSILSDTYASLSVENFVYGIGLGGFNNYYYKLTGELGVAAHNDFFLFFVEGGILSLLVYILFLVGGVCFWLKAARQLGSHYLTPLCVFCSLYILSFLNNPYYYPQVQVVGSALMGGFTACYVLALRRIRDVHQRT